MGKRNFGFNAELEKDSSNMLSYCMGSRGFARVFVFMAFCITIKGNVWWYGQGEALEMFCEIYLNLLLIV
jgi:hypothetical protein